MFGVSDDDLIENLELLRKRLCGYGPDAERCDCKFAGTRRGEQTGCPEIRQAIAYLKGQREEVARLDKMFEASAVNALAKIRSVIAQHDAATSPEATKGGGES